VTAPLLNSEIMADAKLTLAPSKDQKDERFKAERLALEQEFDINKKYVFQLAIENLERELPVIGMVGQKAAAEPHKKFKPYQNIVLTSQIVWKGQRRMLRYYDGCESIFVDEQPKDKELIDQLIKQTQPRAFLEGKFGCHGDQKQFLLYMTICSWNAESPFRTRSADAIFVPVDQAKRATNESLKLDQTERALQLAKDASVTKMMIHASYLGIALVDYDSDNELSEDEIRAFYRKEALRNSANFIESYGNKAIEIKYYIGKALQQGLISNKLNPNKVAWASSGNVICDISGLKSNEAIGEKIFEFSQLAEGEEFVIQLKALYN
jgi:hypothetical protein